MKSCTPFAAKLGAKICAEIAAGQSLVEVCEQPGMPDARSVRRWVAARPEFRDAYLTARALWCHAVAEDLNALADSAPAVAAAADAREGNSNAAVAALRLQIDSKKWLLSKLNPAQFGDRLATEITGKDGGPLMAAEPDRSKLALILLGMLSGGGQEPLEQPVIEHEAAEAPAEPIKLTLDPDPEPRPAIPARSLLATRQFDEDLAQREAASTREGARLRLVQLGGEDRLPRVRTRDPRGFR
ncbi:MAG TPA: hypothetical protein VIM52_08010, partial [Stellaceae bacterium]